MGLNGEGYSLCKSISGAKSSESAEIFSGPLEAVHTQSLYIGKGKADAPLGLQTCLPS